MVGGIPNLHLRAASQLDPAVPRCLDLPIHVRLKVPIIFDGAKTVPLAVKNQRSILHPPVGFHALVSLRLRRFHFLLAHLAAGFRVAHQPFPPCEILAIEKSNEPIWG